MPLDGKRVSELSRVSKTTEDALLVVDNGGKELNSIFVRDLVVSSSSGNGFDFIGTEEEFNTALLSGKITDETVSLVTDDVYSIDEELGGITESLNNKADADLGNITDSGKETAVSWGRNFVNTNQTVASGTTGIAGTYNLGFTDGKVRIGVFACGMSTTKDGFSNMTIKTDIVAEACVVTGTNNGFAAQSTVTLPFVNSVSIAFPSTGAGIGTSTVKLIGYFE